MLCVFRSSGYSEKCGKVPSLVFGSFLCLFTKENTTLHERRRKLEKLAFKRMLDGRSEWRGTSGFKWVTTQ